MLPKDFVLFIEGYNDRVLKSHEIARRQAYFMLAPHIGKPLSMAQFFKQYWPLPSDGDDKERKQRLIDKFKRLKENGARRVTDTDRG